MSDEKNEKKEQLRSKVQALVSYYEEEKRRNEELEMEIERLRAQQHSGEFQAAPPPQAIPGFNMQPAQAPQPSYQMQHFAPPAPPPPAAPQQPANYGSYSNNRYAAPAAPPAPAYPAPQAGASCQRTIQCIEQLRARLQQASYDSYNAPYTDYETLGLMDRLQDQLGELCRDLGMPAPQPSYYAPPAPAPMAPMYPPQPPRYY